MTDVPNSAPSTPPRNSEQLARFFDWVRSAGIVRGSDRWLAGVCGAIARRTGLDPMIVRGIAVVLAVLGAPVLFAYAVGWALLPNSAGRIHVEQAFQRHFEPAMVAIGALLLVTLFPAAQGLWWDGPPAAWGMPDWLATTFTVGWSLAVVAGIVWLVVFLLRRVPAPRPPGSTGPGSTGPGPVSSVPGTAGSSTDAATNAPQQAAFATGYPAPARAADANLDATAAYPRNTDASGAAAYGAVDAPWQSSWDAIQEKNRIRREQKQAYRSAHEARDRARHTGAGFTAIVLGIALLGGAIAAGLYSAGTWSPAALLIGLATGLGVLAVGIIVAGIRGRVSGAMGGFAFLTTVTLLVLGVFPQGTAFSPFGGSTWHVGPDAVPGYSMIAGQATIDLTGLDEATGRSTRTIDVWLGAGVTELVLPTSRAVRVEAHSLIGGIDYTIAAGLGSDSTGTDLERGGLFFHDDTTFNDRTGREAAVVRVWSLVGQTTIAGPGR